LGRSWCLQGRTTVAVAAAAVHVPSRSSCI
jgi:hypothetical protein